MSVGEILHRTYVQLIMLHQKETTMRKDYFEQLHREEQRRHEWHVLDMALSNPQTYRPAPMSAIRATLGQWLIQAGTVLAGKPAV